MFTKATKKQAKLRMALCGPAGSGKTYTALQIAQCLGVKRLGLIDSEHGSASLYSDKFPFDALELNDFAIERYIGAIQEAAKAGYDGLIVDSLTHAWAGKNGALELVDRSAGTSGNKFAGWKTVTPLQNRLVDALLSYPGHVIVTIRSKMEYVLEENERGKKVPRKVGMAPIQRDGIEYEFTVTIDLATDGSLSISKSRCEAVQGAGIRTDIPDMVGKLKGWLEGGAPAPEPVKEAPAPSTNGHALDWSTNGAPTSARARIEVALAEAQNRSDIDKVVPTIQTLPKAEQLSLRPLFRAALERVNASVRQ